MNKPVGLQRAYSVLTIKAIDEKKRTFTGIASTPETDRMGDIVEPKGAQFKLPLPLLWQHNSQDPIGWVKSAKVTADGIAVECEIADIADEGELKARLTKAWQYIKNGLVRGLSIGFDPKEWSEIEGSWGYRFRAWEWLELSAVTIPANQEANISAVKSIDRELLAASGRAQRGVVRLGSSSPGVTGTRSTPTNPERNVKLKEQIASFEAKRQASAARMDAIMEKAAAEGRTLDEAESQEYDTLNGEVQKVDQHLVRLREKERSDELAAKAVDVRPGAERASQSRGPAIIVNREPEEKFKGQKYTRMIIAKTLAALDSVSPVTIARQRGWDKTDPTLFALIQKANEVSAGGEQSGQWGAELAASDTRYTGDFIEYLYSRTVFDKLPLRQVPANIHIKGQDGAATAYWVGEKKAIPVTAMDFSDVELRNLKVAAIAVISNELLRDSSPAAEQLVRDGIVEASSQRVDTTFLSASGAVSGVSPAGILNGLSPIPASGWDADAVVADIKSLYAPFITAKNATGLQFVMNSALAKALSLMRNALGQKSFPDITATGGTLEGDAVTTGDNVNPLHLILLKPSDIYRIGDTGVEVSVSRDATIEMSSAPTGDAHTPDGGTENPVSMFQTESTALKVVRRLNFAKRRASAVQFVADAEYGTETSST